MSEILGWNNFKTLNLNFLNTLKMIAVSKDDKNQESALLLTKRGDVYGIGENKESCLGLDLINTEEPVKIDELSGVSGVCVCGWFGDALAYTRENGVYVWGENVLGATHNKPLLLKIPASVTNARCIHGHYLALTESGKVYEWRGFRTFNSALNTLNTIPTLVSLNDDIISIACGVYHSLAVTKNGYVFSWGKKYIAGQFITQPMTKISLERETVIEVACGAFHSLALTQSGKIFTWGWNVRGLGDNEGNFKSETPLQVGNNMWRFVDIATNGWQTNAARTESGAVYMWGEDENGMHMKSVTITECTKLQQVFSKVIYSTFAWICKDYDSCLDTNENSTMLGNKIPTIFNNKEFVTENVKSITLKEKNYKIKTDYEFRWQLLNDYCRNTCRTRKGCFTTCKSNCVIEI